MRSIIITLLVLAIALAAYAAYVYSDGGEPVETADAKLGEIREFVTERGKTRLPRTYLITMPFNGRIAEINVAEGRQVKKDELLAKIVPVDLDLEVQDAKAAVDRLGASIRESEDITVEETAMKQSKEYVTAMNKAVDAAQEQLKASGAKLEVARKHFERVRSLYQTGKMTQDELDQANLSYVESNVSHEQNNLTYRGLQAIQIATALLPIAIEQYIHRKGFSTDVVRHEQAQALVKLEQVKKNAERGAMRSPVDGVVLARNITNERYLSAGETLLEVGRLEELEIEADVLSQDVVAVKPDDQVDIYGPAIGPDPVQGRVKQIYPAGFTKVSSLGVEQQRVKVIISLDKQTLTRLREQRGLGVGYRVRVRIYTAKRSQTLVIPRSALFRGAAETWQLFVMRDDAARLQTVEVGLMNDEWAEITKGIGEGDRVILAPETNLTDGAHVRAIR